MFLIVDFDFAGIELCPRTYNYAYKNGTECCDSYVEWTDSTCSGESQSCAGQRCEDCKFLELIYQINL